MVSEIHQPRVLIVDDSAENIQALIEVLKHEYVLVAETDGERALALALREPYPDLILLDVVMPGIDGYEVCRRLKDDARTRDIPVIFVTLRDDEIGEMHGFDLGAVDYIAKPIVPCIVRARVKTHIGLKQYQDKLSALVETRTRQLQLTQEITIHAMASLAEYRDPETGGHIKRTQNYVKILAQHLQKHPKFSGCFNNVEIEALYRSAPLHDIGKVGIQDSILLKPGKLTEDEFERMKEHVIIGRDAIISCEKRLGRDSFLKYAHEIAESHHEKWDGSGYPYGLKGEKIPISGRLMAIADVYDALISKRVYKPPLPHSEAVKYILENRSIHFDPLMVDIFEEIHELFRETALQYTDHEEEKEMLKKK